MPPPPGLCATSIEIWRRAVPFLMVSDELTLGRRRVACAFVSTATMYVAVRAMVHAVGVTQRHDPTVTIPRLAHELAEQRQFLLDLCARFGMTSPPPSNMDADACHAWDQWLTTFFRLPEPGAEVNVTELRETCTSLAAIVKDLKDGAWWQTR